MSEDVEPGDVIDINEGVEDVVFARRTQRELYENGYLLVHPERWDRLHRDVPFEDVVALFEPFVQEFISCPFHGRDRTPSFKLYRRSNDAWCFGCPPKQQYYDHVIFVAAKLDCSKRKALAWLEQQFHLPAIADLRRDELEDEEQSQDVVLTFEDLKMPFIHHASAEVMRERDPELARQYLKILFDCWPAREALQQNPSAGEALPLARMLGRDRVAELLRAKTLKR